MQGPGWTRIIAGALGLGAAWAGPAGAAPVAFSSAYTHFPRDCRPVPGRAPPPDSLEARLAPRPPLTCRGPGGHAVLVSFAPRTVDLFIGLPGPGLFDGRERLVATQSPAFLRRPGSRLEWRLADRRPFAVILRVTDDPVQGTASRATDAYYPFAAPYTFQPSLLAVGLPGFEQIRTVVSDDRPDAAAVFRQRVDAMYAPPVGKTAPRPDAR